MSRPEGLPAAASRQLSSADANEETFLNSRDKWFAEAELSEVNIRLDKRKAKAKNLRKATWQGYC